MKRKEMASSAWQSPDGPEEGDARLLLLLTGEGCLMAGLDSRFPLLPSPIPFLMHSLPLMVFSIHVRITMKLHGQRGGAHSPSPLQKPVGRGWGATGRVVPPAEGWSGGTWCREGWLQCHHGPGQFPDFTIQAKRGENSLKSHG